jgi:nucleolar protein 58
VSLLAFRKFEDTADALSAATAIVEGKLSKNLKKFLRKSVIQKDLKERLAVADAKLKTLIREKLGIETVHDETVMELFRCIRFQLKSLLSDNLTDSDMNSMVLGLSHSLSRYKIKFSPDKVDIMIVQAICTNINLSLSLSLSLFPSLSFSLSSHTLSHYHTITHKPLWFVSKVIPSNE